jgi:Ca2+-binding RTX toxin-like protein
MYTVGSKHGQDIISHQSGTGRDLVCGDHCELTIDAPSGRPILMRDTNVTLGGMSSLCRHHIVIPGNIYATCAHNVASQPLCIMLKFRYRVRAGLDAINVGNGDSVVIGGSSADAIVSGSGNDLICGDHCYVAFNASWYCGQGCVPNTTNTLVQAPMQLEFVVTTFPNITGGVLANFAVLWHMKACRM